MTILKFVDRIGYSTSAVFYRGKNLHFFFGVKPEDRTEGASSIMPSETCPIHVQKPIVVYHNFSSGTACVIRGMSIKATAATDSSVWWRIVDLTFRATGLEI
jgi:hypothetical protein